MRAVRDQTPSATGYVLLLVADDVGRDVAPFYPVPDRLAASIRRRMPGLIIPSRRSP